MSSNFRELTLALLEHISGLAKRFSNEIWSLNRFHYAYSRLFSIAFVTTLMISSIPQFRKKVQRSVPFKHRSFARIFPLFSRRSISYLVCNPSWRGGEKRRFAFSNSHFWFQTPLHFRCRSMVESPWRQIVVWTDEIQEKKKCKNKNDQKSLTRPLCAQSPNLKQVTMWYDFTTRTKNLVGSGPR